MNKRQRKKIFEMNYRELWELDTTFARWFVPRLKRFIKEHDGYPSSLTWEIWNKLLDEMLEGMVLLSYGKHKWTEEQQSKIDRALDIFREYFFHLWI